MIYIPYVLLVFADSSSVTLYDPDISYHFIDTCEAHIDFLRDRFAAVKEELKITNGYFTCIKIPFLSQL